MVKLKNDHFKNGVKKFYENTVKKNKCLPRPPDIFRAGREEIPCWGLNPAAAG